MEELFSEFRNISFKEWKNKVNFDLKGKDFNQTLNWHNIEGINVPPYFSAESNIKKSINTRISDYNLKISKTFTLKNDNRSKQILKTILSEELDSIRIFIPSEFELEDLKKIDTLYNKDIQFEFELFVEEYIETISELALKMKSGKMIYLNLDLINRFSSEGNWINSKKEDLELIKKINSIQNDNIIPFSVNTSTYQNAGANIVQQITYALATTVEYVSILDINFFSKVQYNFSFGTSFFFEIAKISVFEHLLNIIKTKYNTFSENIISGESSIRNKTIYDSHNNMLRSTTEAFSAIIAGVNTFTTYGFDSTYNVDNSFASRIGYNQLLILKEEAHINKINNISEGSYYIDYIKNELAEKSLEIFKLIENGGGFLKQLEEGIIGKKIEESNKKEQDLFNKGNSIIIGSNSFINENEKINSSIRKYPFQKYTHQKTIIKKISPKRLSETIEKLRLNSEKK